MTAMFGTSGLRGLASELIGNSTYSYVTAFADHLMNLAHAKWGSHVCVGWDFRDSSPTIVEGVVQALAARSLCPILCGSVPTQALAFRAMSQGLAAIMITGSHTAADRNGIKFYLPTGEISKADEQAISMGANAVPPIGYGEGSRYFNFSALSASDERTTRDLFIARYLSAFNPGCLANLRIGVYQHSSVARDMLSEILGKLGAHVVNVGRESCFVPVDTEAIAPEIELNFKKWASQYNFHAIVSADGDGDRPLVADEIGAVIRGDLLGLLTALTINAGAVVTPITSNSGIEKMLDAKVLRTRVGSPFVIAAMEVAAKQGYARVIGFEANGGFLTGSSFRLDRDELAALPTRDSFLPIISVLSRCAATRQPLSELKMEHQLPVATSGRIENFPIECSNEILKYLSVSEANISRFFSTRAKVSSLNEIDGLRFALDNGEIVHFRASGNAPEFRVYVEAATADASPLLLSWSFAAIEELRQHLFRTTS